MASGSRLSAIQFLRQANTGHQPAALLAAGVKTGVFGALSRGRGRSAGAASLARELRCDERGMRILCDALTVFGVLQKKIGKYSLRTPFRKYLDPSSPTYFGMRYLHLDESLRWWANLDRAVRTGRPLANVGSKKGGKKVFQHIAPGLFTYNYPHAIRIARRLGGSPAEIIDLGAGSGVWGIGAARVYTRAKITATDLPDILPIIRKYVRQEKLEKRFRTRSLDLRTGDLGREKYDLAILGLVAHQFGEKRNRQVFRKVFHCLRPGGRFLLPEFVPNEARTAPKGNVVFALNMLLGTKAGDAWTMRQYREWLRDAGFTPDPDPGSWGRDQLHRRREIPEAWEKMKIPRLHSWKLKPKQAVTLQKKLRTKLRLSGRPRRPRYIAGADAAFREGKVIAAIVLWDRVTGKVLERRRVERKLTFPYVPGLLSFREGPALLDAFRQLQRKPDLILFDGQGFAHPRRLGIASHLGLWLDVPTIGVAKSRLVGEHKTPAARRGSYRSLYHKGEKIGVVFRSRDGGNPLFLSSGNRVSPEALVPLVKSCLRGYRLPEPTRLADQLSKKTR